MRMISVSGNIQYNLQMEHRMASTRTNQPEKKRWIKLVLEWTLKTIHVETVSNSNNSKVLK